MSAVNFGKMEKPKWVAIVGPTATGKSSLALKLALRFKGEIISADSVQVYRGLDIGSAKPSPEERRQVPHHLIDILDPDQEYSAALFRRQADEIIHELSQRKTPIFVVGGTGLYLKVLSRGLFRGPGGDSRLRTDLYRKAQLHGSEALHRELEELDPETASQIHPHDTFRIIRALEVYALTQRPISHFRKEHGFRENPYRVLKVGLQLDREELYRRIEQRVDEMMERGWLEEVKSLLDRGYSSSLRSLQSLGYRSIVSYLSGDGDLEKTVSLIKRDTRRYAKRQMTWFKADPEILWFPADEDSFAQVEEAVAQFLEED